MIGQKQFGVGIKIGGKLDGSLLRSIRVAETKITGLGKNLGRSLTSAAQAGQRGFMGVANNEAYRAAAVGAAGIGLALGSALRVSMQFEKSASSLQAKLQATPQQMIPLLEQAKELGSSTKFTASQAVEAMDFLAMAGYKANDILKVTPGVLKLAAMANMDLAESADIASNILGGMRLPISKTNNLVDLLAKTSVSGNLDLRMLGESFKYVGPVAAQAGINMEKMAAAMAILGDSGIQASEAGTGLRGVILRLAAPPAEAAAALKTLGVATADAKGDLKDFPVLLAELGTALSKVQGSANRAAILEGLFGKLQAAAGGVLLEAGRTGALAERVLTVSDNAGAAGKMAEQMQNNLAGSVTRLGSAWEGLQLAMADPKGTGGLKDLVDGLASFLGTATRFANENPKLTSALVATAAGLSALVLAAPFLAATISVIGSLGTGLGVLFGVLSSGSILATAAGWLGALGPALAALTGPVGLAVLAVVGLGLAFMAAYKNVEWFRVRVDKWMVSFKTGWSGLVTALGGAWEIFVGIMTLDVGKIGKGWRKLTDGMRRMWNGFTGTIAALFGTSIVRVQGFFDFFVGLFTGDVGKMTKGWKDATDGFGPAFDGAMKKVGEAFNRLVAQLRDEARRSFDSLGKTAGEKFVNGFKLAFKNGTPIGWLSQLVGGIDRATGGGAPSGGSGLNLRTSLAAYNRPTPGSAGMDWGSYGRPGRALGGQVFRGVDYLVGENRAEVFRPQTSGRIFPSLDAANQVAPSPRQSVAPGRGGGGPLLVMEPGAIQVSVGSGDPGTVERAVAAALERFRYELQSSYRSMLSD